jgi:hypothetical protein
MVVRVAFSITARFLARFRCLLLRFLSLDLRRHSRNQADLSAPDGSCR